MTRVGILVSHPIQYYAPWFRYLAKRFDVEVHYAHRVDAKGQAEAGFGVEFDWDVPLLDGYTHRWLRNVARNPGVNSFMGSDTPEVYDLVRFGKFDAFLALGWSNKSAIQVTRACWRNNTPVFMRGDSQLDTPRSWVKSTLKYLPYRWFLPRLDAHLYVGRNNKAYLRHYGVPENRLVFAPHFVDNDYFNGRAMEAQTQGRSAQIRAEQGLPPNAFVFLFVGKMILKKRPADFIQACIKAIESREGSSVHALLVGDGPLRRSLETMARPYQGRIRFAGFRNQTELPAFYKASNALVLSSDGRETWGLVANEAMACGIPAIVSNAAGCAPDLIDEGKTGYSYPVGDVAALMNRMIALKALCESQPEVVRQALAAKVTCYSMKRATEGLEEAIAMRRGMKKAVSSP